MYLEICYSELGSVSPQRHLLAVQPPILEAAIHAGNEFRHIRKPVDGSPVLIQNINGPEVETTVAAVDVSPLRKLRSEIQKITEIVDQRRSPAIRRPGSRASIIKKLCC